MGIDFRTELGGVDWAALRRDLIADDFHNGRTTAQLRMSFENSARVAIARDGARVVGTARALSDGVGNAYVIDVWTHSGYRGRGIGTRMMRMLLDAVPGQHVYLQADEARGFYRRLGFEEQPVGLSVISGAYLENETLDA